MKFVKEDEIIYFQVLHFISNCKPVPGHVFFFFFELMRQQWLQGLWFKKFEMQKITQGGKR